MYSFTAAGSLIRVEGIGPALESSKEDFDFQYTGGQVLVMIQHGAILWKYMDFDDIEISGEAVTDQADFITKKDVLFAETGGGGGGGDVTSVQGRTGAVVITKGDVGLGNATNTSDANKPVSSAQQTALDLKAPLASPTFTGTVAGVTKGMVGLGNVDNTADSAKPVSTAAQTALTLKANIANPVFTTGIETPALKVSGGTLGAGKVLTDVAGDGIYTPQTPPGAGAGSGDVVGPGSATDNAIARFDSTTGKLLQNSAATIADTSGNIAAGTYNGNAIGAGSTSGTNTGDQDLPDYSFGETIFLKCDQVTQGHEFE